MKIVICPYNFHHQPIAGGEIYLSRLIDHLIDKRHEIRIITGHTEHYLYKGIDCYPQGEMAEIWLNNNDHFNWCDIVLTHLIGSPYGFNKATQHKKKIVFIAHNNSTGYPVKNCAQQDCHVIYNSFQLREDLQLSFGHFNGTVLHPLMPQFKKSNGNCVTLVNLNYNKGGHILIEIARLLSQINFIGVMGGYGEQVTEDLPNIKYLPNGTEMSDVYAETKILIVPSEFESYSQCATEAMACGIPVIAHPTPGLKENLAYAGLFISRDGITSYANKILYLINNKEAYNQQSDKCLRRANNMHEMSIKELNIFDNWLSKIV